MPKKSGFALPGFPNATLASVYCLKQNYQWDEQRLHWLENNWIKLDTLDQGLAVYAKPGSSFDDPSFRQADKHLVSTTRRGHLQNRSEGTSSDAC